MAETLTERLSGFLVEDMILALGNLRNALTWLGEDIAPEARRAAISRLMREIDFLEGRARDMRAELAGPGAPPSPVTAGTADSAPFAAAVPPHPAPAATPEGSGSRAAPLAQAGAALHAEEAGDRFNIFDDEAFAEPSPHAQGSTRGPSFRSRRTGPA